MSLRATALLARALHVRRAVTTCMIMKELGYWQRVYDFSLAADGHWVCCPRNALRRAVRLAREQHGVAFRVGFETEFVLLRLPIPSDLAKLASSAVDSSLYCQSFRAGWWRVLCGAGLQWQWLQGSAQAAAPCSRLSCHTHLPLAVCHCQC